MDMDTEKAMKTIQEIAAKIPKALLAVLRFFKEGMDYSDPLMKTIAPYARNENDRRRR